MRRSYAALLCLLALAAGMAVDDSDARTRSLSPFELRDLTVETEDVDTFRIRLECLVRVSGDVVLTMVDGGGLSVSGDPVLREYAGAGEVVQADWTIQAAASRYSLVQIIATVQQSAPSDDQYRHTDQFVRYLRAVPDNPTLSDNIGQTDSNPIVAPVRSNRPTGVGSVRVGSDMTKDDVSDQTISVGDGVLHATNIYISGRAQYAFSDGCQQLALRGLPSQKVFLDWDWDLDESTYFCPWDDTGCATEGAAFATTDDDGNFVFDFQVLSDTPIDQFAPRLSLFALSNNGAGERAGSGATGLLPLNYTIDIVGAQAVLVYGIAVNAPPHDAAALRHLHHAKEAIDEVFGLNMPIVYYEIDTSQGYSSFDPNSTWITFNRVVPASTGYHEYGHYVDHLLEGGNEPPSSGEEHHFLAQTNDNDAWVEGFAEFCEAIVHEYYYRTRIPERINLDDTEELGQYLDDSQSSLPSGDRTKVEGAVACFLYSVLDGEELRSSVQVSPGVIEDYEGDNEDVTLHPSTFLSRVGQRLGRFMIQILRLSTG